MTRSGGTPHGTPVVPHGTPWSSHGHPMSVLSHPTKFKVSLILGG